MPYYRDGYDWLWMIPMMFFWIVALGAVVYFAVRLGNEHSREHRR